MQVVQLKTEFPAEKTMPLPKVSTHIWLEAEEQCRLVVVSSISYILSETNCPPLKKLTFWQPNLS